MEKPEQAEIGTTPFPLALLLCDKAIVEESNKKKTLVGIFDRIWVQRFPTSHSPLTIYARLTDAQGNYDFRIEYVQVKTDRVLGKASVSGIQIPDRLQVSEILFQPPPLSIPEPGEYEFRLWANDQYIGRVKFTALEAKKEG